MQHDNRKQILQKFVLIFQSTIGFINSKLQRDNFRLGYALKITFRIKEHSYSELKKIESYEFINLSGLIY